MKKITVLAFLCSCLVSAGLAVNFDMQRSRNIDDNNGLADVPDVNLEFDNSVSGFDLVWSQDEDIIWDRNLQNLSGITGDVSFSTGYKRMSFSGEFSGNISVKGVKARTYKEDFRAYLGLNNTGDKEVDNWSSEYIEYDDSRSNSEYDDETPPLSPQSVKYNISGGKVFVEWQKSPDLDVEYHILRLYRNGEFYKDIRVSGDSYTISSLDFSEYDWSIKIMAKDKYYLSEGPEVTLEEIDGEDKEQEDEYLTGDDSSLTGDTDAGTGDSDLTGDTQQDISTGDVSDESGVCIQVIQHARNPETGECKAFPTPCDVPDGWEKVSSCDMKQTFTGFQQRTVYSYKNEVFNQFQTEFDNRIEKIIKDLKLDKKQDIIEVRDNILEVLKDYEQNRLTEEQTISRLTSLAMDFKLLINDS